MKDIKDMDFSDLLNEASRIAHSELLAKGGTGLRLSMSTIYNLMCQWMKEHDKTINNDFQKAFTAVNELKVEYLKSMKKDPLEEWKAGRYEGVKEAFKKLVAIQKGKK